MAKPRSPAPSYGSGRTAPGFAQASNERRRCSRGGGSRAAAYGPVLGGFWTSLRRVASIPGFRLAAWAPVAVRRSGTSIGKGKVGYASLKSAGWLSSLALSKAKRKNNNKYLQPEPLAVRQHDVDPI